MGEKKICHYRTTFITCPYCGYENTDSWEVFNEIEGYLHEYECGECEEVFPVHKHCEITYTSDKIQKELTDE